MKNPIGSGHFGQLFLLSIPVVMILLLVRAVTRYPSDSVSLLPVIPMLLVLIFLIAHYNVEVFTCLKKERDERLPNPHKVHNGVTWMLLTDQAQIAGDPMNGNDSPDATVSIPKGVWIGVGDYLLHRNHTLIVWEDKWYWIEGRIERPPYGITIGKTLQ